MRDIMQVIDFLFIQHNKFVVWIEQYYNTAVYSLAYVFPVIGKMNQNSNINLHCSKYESETITSLCVTQKWPMQLLMSWQALKQRTWNSARMGIK